MTTNEYDPSALPRAILTRWIKRCQKWDRHLADVKAGRATHNVRLCPSKASKHRAYAAGYQLATATGQDVPHTYAALCALVGLADTRNTSTEA